jgi:hypothetical protein
MANFEKPQGADVHGWDMANYRVTVGVGDTVTVWLYGGGPPPENADLDVQIATGAFAERTETAKPNASNRRAFAIKGIAIGTTTLEAYLPNTRQPYSNPLGVVVTHKALPTSKAGKLAFDDPDLAAINAIDFINPTSITEAVEYSGIIYKVANGELYGYTQPMRGDPTAAVPLMQVPAGSVVVATYHTHGAGSQTNSSAEGFSPQDRGFHNLRQLDGYLGTPKGSVFLFRHGPKPDNPGMAAFGGKATLIRQNKEY